MKNEFDNSTGQLREQLLRKKKVAEALDCSERSVDRLAACGKLTRVPLLGGTRFRRSEVELLMNGGKTNDFQR
jgi:hypothetical protein